MLPLTSLGNLMLLGSASGVYGNYWIVHLASLSNGPYQQCEALLKNEAMYEACEWYRATFLKIRSVCFAADVIDPSTLRRRWRESSWRENNAAFMPCQSNWKMSHCYKWEALMQCSRKVVPIVSPVVTPHKWRLIDKFNYIYLMKVRAEVSIGSGGLLGWRKVQLWWTLTLTFASLTNHKPSWQCWP